MQTEKTVSMPKMNDAVLRWVIEHSSQGLIVTDVELRIHAWSHWLEVKTGRKAAVLIGQKLLEEFPEIVERRLDNYFQQALSGQSNVLSQKLHQFLLDIPATDRIEGQSMRQSVRISPLMDGTSVIGTVTVIDDVTERVTREAQLQRQLEQRAALLESESVARSAAEIANTRLHNLQAISDEAFAQMSLDDLLAKTAQSVRIVLRADTSTILLADENGDLIVRAMDGLPDESVAEIRVPKGTGFAGLIGVERRPQSVAGVLPPSPLNDILSRAGIKALSGVPLLVETRVLGVLHVGMREPRPLSDDDVRFLRLVGDRLSLAIERARLFEGEREARAQAEMANRLKDQFLATVSHELRTPLNAILGWARLLTNKRIDAGTATHAAEVIERNAKAQAQLIDDLLDVSRIISGKLRLNISLVEPVSIIEAALDSVRPAADAKGITLIASLDPNAGPIPGDPDRIQQIVWNLLSNAIKFTSQDGSVVVELKRTPSYLEVRVRDTGQGISPDFLPFVFDRFRQADATVTRTHSGLGLGLAIVRHLVELHGGTVQAESAGKGQGATFSVQFPLLGMLRDTARVTEGSEREVLHRALDGTLPIDGIRIVLVDDAEDAVDLLTTVLEQCGAEVHSARSAEEGLNAVTSLKPDVVISDIEMPGEDGYSFMRKVRSLAPEEGGEVPSVALTAHAKGEDRVRALTAGFNIHVPKPVDPAELLVAIQSLTERSLKVGRSFDTQRLHPIVPAEDN